MKSRTPTKQCPTDVVSAVSRYRKLERKIQKEMKFIGLSSGGDDWNSRVYTFRHYRVNGIIEVQACDLDDHATPPKEFEHVFNQAVRIFIDENWGEFI